MFASNGAGLALLVFERLAFIVFHGFKHTLGVLLGGVELLTRRTAFLFLLLVLLGLVVVLVVWVGLILCL